MIAKTYILANLRMIESLFNKSKSVKNELFYSKLALLDFCGWIEDSMDDIVMTCGNRTLKDAANRKFVDSSIIKRTSGFLYEDHFRKMLIQLMGIINVEKLECKLDPIKFDPMKATLRVLYEIRNKEAHTHLKGVARSLDAPSITRARFQIVYDGLKDIERNIREMKF